MPIHGYPGNVITANPTAPTSSVASGVWTTEQQLIAKAAGNWPTTIPAQQVSRSLRFNPADTAYLNRTLGSSNRRTFTFSAWVKRSLLASNQCIFGNINFAGGGSTNQQFFLGFNGSDQLDLLHYNNGTSNGLTSSAVYRDPSAFYHVVCAIDTTQATSSNRLKLYINGSQITAFASSSYPTQNTDTFINANLATAIGTQIGTGIGNSYYFGGYMAEVYFIDGQQLTPSSFGRNNIDTGVWEPLAYTGTYGTNGFYVNFSDNSNTTAATLGKDYSGNGNNWTPNNFSVTAGAGNDSLVDSPTSYGTDTGAGGEVRGNYCTANPLKKPSTSTITNGNLDVAHTSAGGEQPVTFAFSSGKWYWEVSPNSGVAAYGIILTSVTPSASSINNGYHYYGGNGQFYTGTSGVAYGATFTSGDVIGVALNLDTNQITFYKNGVSQGAQSISAGEYNPDIAAASTNTTNCNFGQRAFAYTAPSGFKALCTQNLPTPTIGATSTTQANDYMNVALWTGTGSSQNITGLGFQPDFVWGKMRNSADKHYLFNQLAGVNKFLSSNLTAAETTDATILTSFNADGFTLGTSVDLNRSGGYNYVGWAWNAGGSTVTNTSGTISAQVRANTTSGFSIVTYTGNGTAGATVGHGLGVAPSMIILKDRDSNTNQNNWLVWHTSLSANNNLYLSTTDAQASYTVTSYGGIGTSPTSTTFLLGSGTVSNATPNENGDRYVAYCFAPVAGYSAFGSFTGNGSADGPFVFLGFRPAFVMAKLSSATGDWNMVDDMRQTYNDASGNPVLRANLNSAEEDVDTMQGQMDLLSNGFKLRSNNSSLNANGGTIIYAAFAENPFKYSLAR